MKQLVNLKPVHEMNLLSYYEHRMKHTLSNFSEKKQRQQQETNRI